MNASAYVLREVNVLDRSGSFAARWTSTSTTAGSRGSTGTCRAQGAASIDFSGLWLLPGIFDCHDHVTMSTVDMAEILSDAGHAVGARGRAERPAHAREPASPSCAISPGADRGFRDSIRNGHVPGPRLQISVMLICQTGGHGDGFLGGRASRRA